MNQHHQDAQRDQANMIFEYTLSQAIADGVLHSVGWTGNGKPLVGTAGTVKDLYRIKVNGSVTSCRILAAFGAAPVLTDQCDEELIPSQSP